MSNNTFASRDVCDLTFLDYATQKPVLYMDYANTTTVGLTGETVFAYGGHGHPKRVGFNGDRGGTISFESQIATMELYALVTGGVLKNAAKFLKREEIAAGSDGLSLKETPVEGSVTVYPLEKDCDASSEVKNVQVSGLKVTSTSGITNGSKYAVYYMVNKESGVKSFKVQSTSFPKEVTIHGFTNMRMEDGSDHDFRMVCYKALPQPTFDLNFANSGDPSTYTITFDLEADGNKDLIEYIALD